MPKVPWPERIRVRKPPAVGRQAGKRIINSCGRMGAGIVERVMHPENPSPVSMAIPLGPGSHAAEGRKGRYDDGSPRASPAGDSNAAPRCRRAQMFERRAIEDRDLNLNSSPGALVTPVYMQGRPSGCSGRSHYSRPLPRFTFGRRRIAGRVGRDRRERGQTVSPDEMLRRRCRCRGEAAGDNPRAGSTGGGSHCRSPHTGLARWSARAPGRAARDGPRSGQKTQAWAASPACSTRPRQGGRDRHLEHRDSAGRLLRKSKAPRRD